jgi:hypothetical protein
MKTKTWITPWVPVPRTYQHESAIVCDILTKPDLFTQHLPESQATQVFLELRGYIGADFYRLCHSRTFSDILV